jgi:hypothetical protein
LVPAGALSSATVLTVQAQPSAIPSTGRVVLVGGATGVVVGTPFVLGPEGQTFATPVTVTLPFQPAKLPAGASTADVVIATAPAGGNTPRDAIADAPLFIDQRDCRTVFLDMSYPAEASSRVRSESRSQSRQSSTG